MNKHEKTDGVNSTHIDGIATIEFFGSKANALTSQVLTELVSTIENASGDDAVKVILLKSRGDRAFCAGASFDDLQRVKSVEEATEFFLGFARVILALKHSPKLVVARVQGKVVGGGVGLVAASDYGLATKEAAIRLSELGIGLAPMTIAPAVQHKIGLAQIGALSIDCEWRTAEWAERAGLYARTVPDMTTLDLEVTDLLAKLKGYSPDAVRVWKGALWSGTESWSEVLQERARAVAELAIRNFSTGKSLK